LTIRISRWVPVVVLACVAIAAAAIGAYFAGRSSVNAHKKYVLGYHAGFQQGYGSGVSAGESSGEARGKAQGERSGEIRGKRRGEGSGKAEGRAEGEAEGRKEGERSGAKAGQNESFEGYSGGWEIGSWYMIKVGAGSEATRAAARRRPANDDRPGAT
jgi:hypothetical protein